MQVSGQNAAKEALFTANLKATAAEGTSTQDSIVRNRQEASAESLAKEAEENPLMGAAARTIKLRPPEKSARTEKAKEAGESVLVRKEDADGFAESFNKQEDNPLYHLDPQLLSQLAQELGKELTEKSTPDEILALIESRMTTTNSTTGQAEPPLASHVQKGLEFLLMVATNKSERAPPAVKANMEKLIVNLQTAKETHAASHTKELHQTTSMLRVASQVTDESGMSFTSTMKRMHEIVNTPQGVQEKRHMYENKGHGKYDEMVKDSKEFFRYLGDALKDPHLDKIAQGRLISEIHNIRSGCWVVKQADAQFKAMTRYLARKQVIETT